MGLPLAPDGAHSATLIDAEFTATHTYFELSAGNASILLDFFSPVTPKDLVRQSLPFSYLTVSATGSSNVQVYTDIDESWTAQSGNTLSNFTTSSGTLIYELSVEGAKPFDTNGDRALWGTVVLAAGNSNGTEVQAGNGVYQDLRSEFISSGSLAGGNSSYAVGDVVALAQNITSTSNATFVLGYVRTPAINFLGKSQAHYYMSQYKNTLTAVQAFINDYPNAVAESQALDTEIASAALSTAGSNYSDIVTLSVRQSYGASDVVIPADSLDTNSTFVFLKEISSDGDANTVDVIFPTFPIWYTMSPDWIQFTLEPLLQYLQSGKWTLPFFVHDLGFYPNALGFANSNDDEKQPVEECGNALILAYAYASATGDVSWVSQYTGVLQKYAADYLIKSGLNQKAQLSSDDGAGPAANQTNLAIKAAVGLNAFGQMTGMTNYSEAGLSIANQIYNDSLATDADKTHFQFQYGSTSNTSHYNNTWITTYNLFPDALFNLSTFPQAAFDMQSDWYPTRFAISANTNGIPLYLGLDWQKTDWVHFAAAVASDATRDLFINSVWAFVSENSTDNQVPFSDKWFIKSQGKDVGGAYFDFKARPVVGGHFAPLAMALGPDSISATGGGNQSSVSTMGTSPQLEEEEGTMHPISNEILRQWGT